MCTSAPHLLEPQLLPLGHLDLEHKLRQALAQPITLQVHAFVEASGLDGEERGAGLGAREGGGG